MPDILDLHLLPYRNYIRKGILLDLYNLIDSDPEFDRSDFMEGALHAAETEGGLYYIFPAFGISTIVGNPSVLGTDPGWTMDELWEVLEANPQADTAISQMLIKSDFLSTVLMSTMDEYVDWATGTAQFDRDDFIRLLEFADTLPAGYDEVGDEETHELIASGRQIMTQIWSFGCFDSLKMHRYMFGGDLVFKGFPTMNRNGHYLNTNFDLAITTGCKSVEGAWEFLRTFLSKEWQHENIIHGFQIFPLNKEVYDAHLAVTMNENRHSSMTIGNRSTITFELEPTTQTDADMVLNIINSLSGTTDMDYSILNIVMENAGDFFNGRITAPDAARIIQNRTQIFLSEQTG
jgi:ABC-type glycerol-3-phosphate transport system substrate-binding protein